MVETKPDLEPKTASLINLSETFRQRTTDKLFRLVGKVLTPIAWLATRETPKMKEKRESTYKINF